MAMPPPIPDWEGRTGSRGVTVVSSALKEPLFLQNLFPIAFSRNWPPKMEKRKSYARLE